MLPLSNWCLDRLYSMQWFIGDIIKWILRFVNNKDNNKGEYKAVCIYEFWLKFQNNIK